MHIVFDFDGTLANSTALVKLHFNELAKRYAKHDVTFHDLYDGGIMHLIKKSGVSFFMVPKIAFELKSMMHTVIGDVKLVPGLLPVIKDLSKKYRLAIVSSNSEENIRDFLKRQSLEPYFDFIHSDSSLFGKDKVLRRLQKKYHIKEMIYVGDEDRDVVAAKHIGIPVVAVTWGYNSRKLLEKKQPSAIVVHPKELLQTLPMCMRQPYRRI